MTVCDIIRTLPAHLIYGATGYQDAPIRHVIAGDLMSDILVSVESGSLLVTSLATEQTIRSADMVGAPAILLVNDKRPTPEMRDLAGELGITLFATPMPMFETCVTLARIQDTIEEDQ